MNTEINKQTYLNTIAVFKTIHDMSAEFKEGLGVDYLVRIVLRGMRDTDEQLIERICAAFAPAKNEQRRQVESRGLTTGIQKAINRLVGLPRNLSSLVKHTMPPSPASIWDKDGSLSPAVIKICVGVPNRIVFIKHWVGVADALEYTPKEIGDMVRLIQEASERLEALKPKILARLGIE